MRIRLVLLVIAVALASACDPGLTMKMVRPDASRPSFCFYNREGDSSPTVHRIEWVVLLDLKPHRVPGQLLWRLKRTFDAACLDFGATEPNVRFSPADGQCILRPSIVAGRCYRFEASSRMMLPGAVDFCAGSDGRVRILNPDYPWGD